MGSAVGTPFGRGDVPGRAPTPAGPAAPVALETAGGATPAPVAPAVAGPGEGGTCAAAAADPDGAASTVAAAGSVPAGASPRADASWSPRAGRADSQIVHATTPALSTPRAAARSPHRPRPPDARPGEPAPTGIRALTAS